MMTNGKAWRWALFVLIAALITILYAWAASHHDWHTLNQGSLAGARWAARVATLAIPVCLVVCAGAMLRVFRRRAFFHGHGSLCGICVFLGVLGAYGGILISLLFFVLFQAFAAFSYFAHSQKARAKQEWYLAWHGVTYGIVMQVIAERRDVWLTATLAVLTILSMIQLYYASQTRRLASAIDNLKETTT